MNNRTIIYILGGSILAILFARGIALGWSSGKMILLFFIPGLLGYMVGYLKR